MSGNVVRHGAGHSGRGEATSNPVAVVGPGWVQLGAERRAFTVRSAADILRVTESPQARMQHPRSAVQVWVLSEADADLGLEVYPEDPDASSSTQRRSVERQLKKQGEPFLAEAVRNGWTVAGGALGARTTLNRQDNSGRFRAVSIVLESYQWIYDDRGDSVAGQEGTLTELAEDPTIRAGQIISRVSTIDQLLGVLPLATTAYTAHKILEDKRKAKLRDRRRGRAREDAAGRNQQRVLEEPGVIPELDGRAGQGGQIMPVINWWRQPTNREIDDASFAVVVDQRFSYPSMCRDQAFGYGTPDWADAAQARRHAEQLTTGETPNLFAIWRTTPTGGQDLYDGPRMFPPHEDLRRGDGPVWVLSPTMRQLVREPDEHGCGATIDDLDISGAWVWPESGRLLEPLYEKVLACWKHIQAMGEDDDPQLRAWLQRWCKSVGRAGIAKLASELSEQDERRPWLYQPMWWEAVKAACAAKLWWQAAIIAEQYHVHPIQASTDSLTYLVNDTIMAAFEERDDGRLGILKVDKVAMLMPEVADEQRARLANLGGRPPNQVIDWFDTNTADTADDQQNQEETAE